MVRCSKSFRRLDVQVATDKNAVAVSARLAVACSLSVGQQSNSRGS